MKYIKLSVDFYSNNKILPISFYIARKKLTETYINIVLILNKKDGEHL